MEHFEDIKRLRELATSLEEITRAYSTVITEKAQARAILAVSEGKEKDLAQRKSTIEEAIRIEKLAINNLPR